MLSTNVFCVDFVDNRPADSSHDRTVPDPNHRLPDAARGLPEGAVHPRVAVHIWSSAASAHSASSGASGPGTGLRLFPFPYLNALSSPADRAPRVTKVAGSQSRPGTLPTDAVCFCV